MPIRLATLDDTTAISGLFCNKIERWQRMDARGQVHDLAYDELSIYERWIHGGAWMSIETAAIWLSHLLRGAALPFVYDDDGIIAYIELYQGNESAPFKQHLHIGQMVTEDPDLQDSMMQFAIEQAQKLGRITASSSTYDKPRLDFYKRYGLNILDQTQQLNMSAASGSVGFYKVTDHPNADSEQINGWQMSIGRTESASYHWQHLWVDLWQAVPRIQAQRTHRIKFNAAGQDAYVCLQQQLYDARSANVYCWTPKNLSSQLIGAIRDWAYRQGYRSLNLAVDRKIADLLGADAEKMPHQQAILARDI